MNNQDTTKAARLPPFNFLEEFVKQLEAKSQPNKEDPVVNQPSVIKPIRQPEPQVVDTPAVVPGDLDLEQFAELMKLIFKKVKANYSR